MTTSSSISASSDHTGAVVTDAETDCYVPVRGGALHAAGEALGDGDYRCVLPDWVLGTVTIMADQGAAHVSIDGLVIGEPRTPDVILWRPTITLEQDDRQLDVSWDSPPPAGAEAFESVLLFHWFAAHFPLEIGATTASVPLDLLEDFTETEMRLSAEQSDDVLVTRRWITFPVSHPAVVPLSRDAGCRVTYEDGAVERMDPGECPLTDGTLTNEWCDPTYNCHFREIAVDLGSERLVRRIVVRTRSSVAIATSLDGVTFEAAPNIDALPSPRSTRYVRVSVDPADDVSIHEISAFAPR